MGLEGLVPRPGHGGPPIAQVARALAPQAVVEPRARDVGTEELAHHRKQVVERQPQGLAQSNRSRLLRGRQHRLKRVRRMAPVRTLSRLRVRHGFRTRGGRVLTPDRLRRYAVAFGHQPGRLGAVAQRLSVSPIHAVDLQ